MTSRDVVLGRIRAALSGGAAPEPASRGYRVDGGLPPGDPALVELFVRRLADYRAVVHRLVGHRAADVAGAVAAIVGSGTVVVPPGLAAEWWPSGLDVVPDDDLSVDRIAAAAAVVTGAALGIAETGTIVLDGSPDQGRRVLTLLPDLHVCVLRPDQVVGTVPEAVTRLASTQAAPGRPLTWISGPSATSDIELNRVEGVHGPRNLHVILLG